VLALLVAPAFHSFVVLQALEDGTVWDDDTSNDDYQIDIGGPSQCGYDAADCFTQYMETVYLFVRE